MMATIDTANARIAKTVTLGTEASFVVVVLDESLVSMVSDELISCGLFICEVVDVMELSADTKPDIRRYFIKYPP